MSIRGDWLLFKTRRSRLKQQVASSFLHPGRRTDELAPEKFKRPEDVKTVPMAGGRIVTLNPKADTTQHVVIFHGGAYTVRATESHRQWMEIINQRLRARATMLDFPLAPEATVKETLAFVLAAYDELRATYPEDHFIFLGDSSGGGLALVTLQQLRAKQLPMPGRTVLVSPWVDLAMRDPEIEALKQRDPELPLQAMRTVGANYAGQLVLDDPLVSPINGSLDHLGRIGLFYGTTELLLPDHRRLAQKLTEADGTQVDVFELKNMLHDFLLWHALPESGRVFKYMSEKQSV